MESKSIDLKLDSEEGIDGSVKALFSAYDVVDHDRDVTVKGAFTEGQAVRLSPYNHKIDELPVGDGNIYSTPQAAIMTGQFYLDTAAGKDTYTAVKRMSAKGLQEWSYEYDVLDSEDGDFKGEKVRFLKGLKVNGVAPVYLGAGIGTQTLDIKSFIDHGEEMARVMDAFLIRAKDRAQYRAKEGRSLSAANRNRLNALVESLAEANAAMQTLLSETDPDKNADELKALRMQFIRTESRMNGVA